LDTKTVRTSRFEVAPGRPTDGSAWRVSLRQVGVLLLAGVAIVGAISMIEGVDPSSAGDAQALALEGAASGPAPKMGEVAPDFTLPDLNGQPIALSSLRGKPVLVNFWATWCPPCRAEMPDLDEVARESSASGLVVLAVNLQEETLPVASYLKTLGVGGVRPILDVNGQVFRQYRIAGLPTTVAIARDGAVADIHIGPLTKRGIQARAAKVT
jgi:thiol-disulfide isomerase/thioredoxin